MCSGTVSGAVSGAVSGTACTGGAMDPPLTPPPLLRSPPPLPPPLPLLPKPRPSPRLESGGPQRCAAAAAAKALALAGLPVEPAGPGSEVVRCARLVGDASPPDPLPPLEFPCGEGEVAGEGGELPLPHCSLPSPREWRRGESKSTPSTCRWRTWGGGGAPATAAAEPGSFLLWRCPTTGEVAPAEGTGSSGSPERCATCSLRFCFHCSSRFDGVVASSPWDPVPVPGSEQGAGARGSGVDRRLGDERTRGRGMRRAHQTPADSGSQNAE